MLKLSASRQFSRIVRKICKTLGTAINQYQVKKKKDFTLRVLFL
jgi:hypothetical protein